MSAQAKASSIKEAPSQPFDAHSNENESPIVGEMSKEANLEKVATPSESLEDDDSPQAPLVATMKDIATRALHLDDDTTLNPWTFRMWFIGKSGCIQ